MIFSNISQFLKQSKKIFHYFFLFVLLFYFSTDFAFAVDDEWLNKTIDILNWILQLVGALLWTFTYLSTLFLSPEWYNWGFFDLDEHFKKIWVLVSNVVYFIFAFIFICFFFGIISE